MKKILVPTDFSSNADKALSFAVQIAKLAKADIVLLHVCSGVIEPAFKNLQTMYNEYNQPIVDQAREQLLSVKGSIAGSENLHINATLYTGSVTDAVLQAVVDHHADLIIMGTLGEAALFGKIFGTQTAEIISKTNVPVIAVPLLCEWVAPQKILLAVNQFYKLPDVINPVFELAVLFNACVHVVTFTDIDTAEADDYLNHKKGIAAYEKKLRENFENTTIISAHLNGNRFQETFEEYIREQRIDIVTMLTRKRTFLESIFNSSMSKKMSYHIQIPLLAIPA